MTVSPARLISGPRGALTVRWLSGQTDQVGPDVLGASRRTPVPYEQGLEAQRITHTSVLEDRAASEALPPGDGAQPPLGTLLLLEHTPVITVSNRPTAMSNLTATEALLARHRVAVAATDRGGDITYHGPGQLVVYPIVDLNRLGLRLHPYMRCMEEAVIQTCSHFGVQAGRDPTATGVWTGTADEPPAVRRKLCAMGVRVSRWVTMHGLALNISPNMDHFGLIVPCGLSGRLVGSLATELASQQRPAPTVESVATQLATDLARTLLAIDRPA